MSRGESIGHNGYSRTERLNGLVLLGETHNQNLNTLVSVKVNITDWICYSGMDVTKRLTGLFH